MIFLFFYFGKEVVVRVFFKVVIIDLNCKDFESGVIICIYGLKLDFNNVELKILKCKCELGVNNKCFI